MKTLRLVLTGIVALLITSSTYGQVRLRLDSLSIPDTVYYSNTDSVTFSAFISNLDTTAFSGQINFRFTISSDSTTVYSDTQGVGTGGGIYFPLGNTNIQGNGSTSITFVGRFSTPFLVGPSVVVIWPVATGAITVDSISIHFDILDTTTAAIVQPNQNQIKVYTFDKQLFIQNALPNQLERVRIYDIGGNTIYNEPFNQAVIPLSGLADGIYFADLLFTDKTHATLKVVNLGR